MGKYTNATQKTKTKLRETFWQIYQEKPIEKISVKEIIEKAHYNRSTFYEYYSDIYAVLDEIEGEVYEGFFGETNQLVLDYNPSFDEVIYEIAQKYKKYEKYLKVLLRKNGDSEFVIKCKEYTKSKIRRLINTTENSPKNIEYYLEYLTNGIFGMLMYWQQHDSKLSIEDFLKIFNEIIQQDTNFLHL